MKTVETVVHADQPTGAPFIIERCPFVYGARMDYAGFDLAEDKILDWPMVYILANNDFAYVGQTTSVASRMSQHGANVEKKDFNTANVIYNEEFNASVVTDYEHRLIDYMHGDGRYQLTNKNGGTSSNYFSKAKYVEMFESLWEELRQLELAEHTLEEIEESEVFKYSPFKSLTVDQRVALDKIMGVIKDGLNNAKPIVIEGMPGTGKTILAIFLLKMLKDDPNFQHLNIKLMEPITSLRETLCDSLKRVSGISSKDIIGPTDLLKPKQGYVEGKTGNFDIVLVDEAHKLKQRVNLGLGIGSYDKINRKLGLDREATQMDWIINQAKLPIFFYDPLQAIGPSCVGQQYFVETLGISPDQIISLDTQMRVKGGKGYLDYIMAILDDQNPDKQTFESYDLVLHDDFSDFVSSFENCYAEHSLSRMVAGYAWKWHTKKHPEPGNYDIDIDEIQLRWNSTNVNWVGLGFDNSQIAHEVGCIHSIQGYDLSYAYVIIGDDIELDSETGLLRANKVNYYDVNGKNTATQEELTQYIKNIYYVLLTRGIYGTHIYVKNPELRKYFAQFF